MGHRGACVGRRIKTQGRGQNSKRRQSAAPSPTILQFEPGDPIIQEAITYLDRTRPKECAKNLPIRKLAIFTVAITLVLMFVAALGLPLLSELSASLLCLVWSGQILLRLYCAVIHLPAKKLDHLQTFGRIWPTYTILAPVFREANVASQLVAALRAIDYPPRALDIILLVEFDDPETLEALRSCNLDHRFRIVVCPNAGPRTKPKALQIGLRLAKGVFVTVYDAEDRPHPLQLKEAAFTFIKSQRELACLQAPLQAIAPRHSLLGRAFVAEYQILFTRILPVLARLGLPFPIGGTSNHFRTKVLRDIGGWDPYNVTEDADLAYRLVRNGFRIGVISPPTLESTPTDFNTYLKQRSRWLKGYFVTYIVTLVNVTKRSKLSYYLSAFILLFCTFASAAFFIIGIMLPLTNMIRYETLSIFQYMFLLWIVAIVACGLRAGCRFLDIGRLVIACLVHQLAACRAIIELVRRPFYWDKTPHYPWRQMRVFIASESGETCAISGNSCNNDVRIC